MNEWMVMVATMNGWLCHGPGSAVQCLEVQMADGDR